MGFPGDSMLSRSGLGIGWALGIAVSIASHAASAEPTSAALEPSEVQGGLVVHLGCGDGKETLALRTSVRFLVHGLDRDPARVAEARRHARERGVSGPVSFAHWADASRLPYADNFVSLLVAEDPGDVSQQEILRALAPGGVARVGKEDGTWTRIFKPWPEGMDAWSHWDHGPDRNPVSQDALVGPPRCIQWVAGPAWSKKHWGPRISAMVTAGGRLFLVHDETPTSLFNIADRWVLVARDAFNGVVLWRRELPDWTGRGWGRVVQRKGSPPAPKGLVLGVWGELSGGSGVRNAMDVMVASGDRLYVPLGADEPLSAIDAATGEVLRTYEGMAPVKEVVLAEGVLLIGARGKVHAVEVESGKPRWELPGAHPCVLDGRAFLTSPGGRSVVCVDLQTGQKTWETEFALTMSAPGSEPPSEKAGFNEPLRAGAGIVLAAARQGKQCRTVALAADDGRPLWQDGIGDRPFARGGGPFFIDGHVWTLDSGKGRLVARDPLTGKPGKQQSVPAIRYVGHHARCYHAKATCRYVIGKERGADFVDLASGEVTWSNWLRGPCHRGVIPANGLLYAGQHSCRCYTEAALHGFHALAPASEESQPPGDDRERPESLVKGSAWADKPQVGPEPAASDDWPTFRHDAARSGATPADFPDGLDERWSAELGCKPSAPVVADGRAYVAAVDRHTLHAFDASTGQPVWQFTAGARIDTPPTIHQGMALFGCRDGWVYCVRADDGRLIWRRRAAPTDRMVGAHGQIESAWPVHGSILVHQDVAYCVAGRSTFLDGGLYVHALEPRTGRVLHTRHLDGPWPGPEVGTSPETPNRGYTSDGALPDVLVADEEHVYLRHLRFDRTLATVENMQPNLYKSPALSGENRGGDHKFWDNLLEAPRHANFSDPKWFHRSFFQNFPGMRLYATTGLVDDDSWHRRMYWSYGQVVGQYLVFRGRTGYAVQVFATSPREGGFNAGDGYVVHAGRTAEREEDEKLFARRPDQSLWRVRVPFRPQAMVLAGERLILTGPPDLADPVEAMEAVEGGKGALLWVLDAADGTRLAEHRLRSVPRYDGMAVTPGRCYVSTLDGRVVCVGDTASQ